MGRNQDVVAIYSRKSRFTGKGESIGNQVELCRDYVRSAYGEVYARGAAVFEDEGFSGGNLDRPGFQQMMRAARERRFRAVVVYRLDRISRSIGDFSALIGELGRLDIDFVSIRESFDTSSPMGRAMMYIASVFSQLERETIAERIRDNLHELAKTGRWLGGVTPTGYASEEVRSVTVDGRSKRSCRLRILPGEAGVVRRIYELYGQTGSLTGTEAALLREGLRTKNGRSFTRFSIRAILQNPVYLMADQAAYRYFTDRGAEVFAAPEAFDGVHGVLAYNRTGQEKGRPTVYRPVCDWIVSVGEHPGLIPSGTWLSVQASLERGRCGAYRQPRSNQALLTGLLRCACGGRMYPKLTQRRTAEGARVYSYFCKRKERSQGGLCAGRSTGGNRLDAAVMEQVKGLAEDRAEVVARLTAGGRGCAGEGAERDRALEDLRRRQADIRRKIDALIDALAGFRGGEAAADVEARIEALKLQDASLRARLAEAEEQREGRVLDGETFAGLCRRLSEFGESAAEMDVEQKRSLLRAVVREVVWDGERAHVYLLGAEESYPWREDSK